MQRIVLMAAAGFLAAALAASGFAQTPAATQPSPQAGRLAHMTKVLDLTPDQQVQVKAILDQARTDAQNATDMQARHQIHKAAFQKIRDTVLTDQQRTKFAQMNRGHARRGMFSQLNLTEDQKAQVKSIMQEARASAQNVTDPKARHQIWKDAFTKVKDTVLTDQQRTQLAQMKAERMHRSRPGCKPACASPSP